MLSRIDKITGCGIFQQYQWDTTLPDFGRINIIYGSNGTGKSSLARALDRSYLQQPDTQASVTVSIKGNNNSPLRFGDSNSKIFDQIYVFSDGYIERSHKLTTTSAEMDAILTLGERTVEAEEQIIKTEKQLESNISELNNQEEIKNKGDRDYSTACRNLAKQIISLTQQAGGKFDARSYNARKVKSIYENSNGLWKLLTTDELKKYQSRIGSENKEIIAEIDAPPNISKIFIEDLVSLLTQTPASVILNTLERHPEATNWVDDGRELHANEDTCIFCGSSFSEERRREIDAHFSDEVEQLKHKLSAAQKRVQQIKFSITHIRNSLPAEGLFFDDIRPEISQAKLEIIQSISAFHKYCDSIIRIIERKQRNVLEVVELPPGKIPFLNVERYNNLVASHNHMVNEHSKIIQQAAEAIESHYLESNKTTILSHLSKSKDADKRISVLKSDINKLQTELQTLQNIEGDPTPSAVTLTKDVSRLLGRAELSFEALEGKFRVLRHGKPAVGLSTGEKTAIMLVHFFELVAKADQVNGKPIVVIDDPVSSLDNDIFLGISTYVWSKLFSDNSIEQIIVLTHNFEFFRQWNIQLAGLPRPDKRSNCPQVYQLRSSYQNLGERIVRASTLETWPSKEMVTWEEGDRDKYRKKLCSSYHHSFMALVEARKRLEEEASLEAKLDATLLYPNVIRRLLESFLAFKLPNSIGNFTGSMRDVVRSTEFNSDICDIDDIRQRLTRYTHSFSHNESPDISEISNVEEISTMIKDTFLFLYHVDRQHFEGLCKAVNVDCQDLISS